jgi:hypothetical protein
MLRETRHPVGPAEVTFPLTHVTVYVTGALPCSRRAFLETTGTKARAARQRAPRWSAGRRAPLRISLRGGRDTEGGCRARSAGRWRHRPAWRGFRPSASRRYGSELVEALSKARAQRRRENALFCAASCFATLRRHHRATPRSAVFVPDRRRSMVTRRRLGSAPWLPIKSGNDDGPRLGYAAKRTG